MQYTNMKKIKLCTTGNTCVNKTKLEVELYEDVSYKQSAVCTFTDTKLNTIIK